MGKNVYVILDTETVTDARLVFDIAWKVYNSKGMLLEEQNFLVSEIINNDLGYIMLSKDSFTKNKFDEYEPLINDSQFSDNILSLYAISEKFNNIGEHYHANVIMCAYNAAFDINVLNQNMQWFYGINFFDKTVDYLDIMVAAMGTICATKRYVKWCIDNNFITEKGNIKTSAEIVYRYMSGDINFIESHTALADCDIEAEIFFKAKSYHKKLVKRLASPIFRCPEWKNIQALR